AAPPPRDLTDAATGAAVIVNALNAPYPDWPDALPRQTAAVLAAARKTGAVQIVAGNVYAYGAGMPATLTEATPHRPTARKGRLRAAQEAAFRAAAERDGVRTVLLRGGDFIDTRNGGNWLDSHISAPLARGRVRYPGPLDRVHAWAFLPDFARACEALARRRDALPAWSPIGFPGHALTGEALIAAMSRAAGRRLSPEPFPWRALRLAAPVWKLGREVLEMRYLWEVPHRIDGAGFDAALPGFRRTPVDEAIAAARAFRLSASGARTGRTPRPPIPGVRRRGKAA
ncbi:MAG: epimerase, partial [Pseudomonadota bacterium]|nr:epimerase [Pseudomonadota bacterium]